MAEALSFKLVFLGDTLVGKTCIVNRINKDVFVDSPVTIGASYVKYKRTIGETEVVANIWDTAGQERYMALTGIYYKKSNVAVIVYDVTNYDSFKRAEFWIGEVRSNLDLCDIILVGNKTDLIDEDISKVSFKSEVDALASKEHCRTAFVSAKSGHGIQELIYMFFECFLSHDYGALLECLKKERDGKKVDARESNVKISKNDDDTVDINDKNDNVKKKKCDCSII